MIDFRWAAISDPGQLREINQDSAFAGDDVFIVADGMGGHNAGEVASRWATLLLHEQLVATPEDPMAAVPTVAWANELIHQQASVEPNLAGMGTTVCVLTVDRETARAKITNVGDSRGYQFRDGTLTQKTEDHSLVETLVREGRLRPEDAIDHPQRNIVTRALGVESDVEVDEFDIDLVAGDRYLLCSDGLSNEVTDQELTEVLAQGRPPQETVDLLVQMANDAGGHDNITCVLVDVIEAEDDGADETSAEVEAGQFVGSVLEADGSVAIMPDVPGRDGGGGRSTVEASSGGSASAATLGDNDDDATPVDARLAAVGTDRADPITSPDVDDSIVSDDTTTRSIRPDGQRAFPLRVLAVVLGLFVALAVALFFLLAGGDSEYFLGFNDEELLVIFKDDGGLLPDPDDVVEVGDVGRNELSPETVTEIDDRQFTGSLEEVREKMVELDTVDEDEGTDSPPDPDDAADSN